MDEYAMDEDFGDEDFDYEEKLEDDMVNGYIDKWSQEALSNSYRSMRGRN